MTKQQREGAGWRFQPARQTLRRVEVISRPPAEQSLRLKIEKPGRGKLVTCIDGFVLSRDDLAAIASQLKATCGTGGTAGDGSVRLQGDCRDRARARLVALGYRVR